MEVVDESEKESERGERVVKGTCWLEPVVTMTGAVDICDPFFFFIPPCFVFVVSFRSCLLLGVVHIDYM